MLCTRMLSHHSQLYSFSFKSTLASQCPPAVGRALGFSVADSLSKSHTPKSTKPISFVTIGDGSVHNAHFLSAFNLASHARFRRKKCPVVFGISDNGLSISYNTDGYAKHWAISNTHSILVPDGIPLFQANGCDMMDVYDKTNQATLYSRKHSAPALILYEELTRRFGHAATDRQHAYLDPSVIESMAEKDVVAGGIQSVEQWNAITYGEVCDRFEQIGNIVKQAFNSAAEESKITNRNEMLERVAQPMVTLPSLPQELLKQSKFSATSKTNKRDVMRKHMTRVIDEVMEANSRVVYIGEDVEHGGYYLVSDGLVKKYPKRVIDFPPDETTLLGVAMGFSQVGLLPIVGKSYLLAA
jgi:TPP-dependent pyruvate/acetoin dehydrogenase alpha subunit